MKFGITFNSFSAELSLLRHKVFFTHSVNSSLTQQMYIEHLSGSGSVLGTEDTMMNERNKTLLACGANILADGDKHTNH